MSKTTRVNTSRIDAAGLISALLVSILFAYVLIGSGLNTASRLKVEASTLSDELDYLRGLSQSLEQGDLTVEMLENNMNAVEKRLPNTMDFQDFYTALTTNAQKEGIRVSKVKQGETIDRESYNEMSVSVSAIAEFSRFHRFLFSLSTMDRLITLESLSIRVSDDPHLCAIEMVLKIYSCEDKETAHGA